ncbi:MAG: 2-C-methyl-D-erythritol 4-phosphate cytidylyltransferase [Defluviitaleaceae bacterium]|nr:2-C-methyl-D-erythritol 4-phosphate cytidylyltransferase [Defluviitaleaceae bacterium]
MQHSKNIGCKVVIPASGIGARFGAALPKQFLPLQGEPILKRTIAAFEAMDMVDEIALAVPPGYAHMVAAYGFAKVRHIVEGGKDRAHSVYQALLRLPKDTDVVLIHDGVRPFVTADLVQAVASAAKQYGAAIACTPVTDTIKQAGAAAPMQIQKTLDRSVLWRAQTPQGFTYDVIVEAYRQGEKSGILHQATDDSALVERLGMPVYIVPGSPRNIKITTAEDMAIATAFLEDL